MKGSMQKYFYNNRSSTGTTIVLISIIFMLTCLIILSLVIKREVIIEAVSEIHVGNNMQVVQSINSMPIKENYLSEGMKVKNGDVLIEYKMDELNSKIKILTEEISDSKSKINELNIFYASVIDGVSKFEEESKWGYSAQFEEYLLQNKYNSSVEEVNNSDKNSKNNANNERINYLQNIVTSLDEEISKLQKERDQLESEVTESSDSTTASENSINKNEIKKNIEASIQELERRKSEIQLSKSEMYSLKLTDLSNLENEKLKQQLLSEILKVKTDEERKLTELKNQIDEAEILKNQEKVLAKIDGVVHINRAAKGLTVVPIGEVIAEIVPDIQELTEIPIVAYISSESAGSIKLGQEAVFESIDSKSNKLKLKANVVEIDSIVSEVEGQKLLRIELRAPVEEQKIKNIRYGLTGKLKITIDSKSYFNYYWDLFFHNQ